MNKSWSKYEQQAISHKQEQVVNKSQPSYEQFMNKSWTKYEQVMNKLRTCS